MQARQAVCRAQARSPATPPPQPLPSARPPPRAFRAVPVALLHVARPRSCQHTDALVEEWGTGIGRSASSFEDICVKPGAGNTKDARAAVDAEGARVLAALTPADFVILMDERGRRVTSGTLTDAIAKGCDRVKPGGRLVVAVGGAHGWSGQVRARADDTLRVSDLVLNHRVARIVAAEALFRSFEILRGSPYHHV